MMKSYDDFYIVNYDWIKILPKEWSIQKLKFWTKIQFSNVDKLTVDGEEKVYLCNYVDVYGNEYIDGNINFMEATATEAEIEKFILQKNDILITKDSETSADIAVPALVIEQFKKVLCGYHLAQIRCIKKEFLPKYLFYLFKSKEFNANFEASANGMTRYGLSVYSIKNVFVTIPLLLEQQKIVEFLDHKTALIDKFITNRKKQIELLEEKKAAIINNAVTKGLNPNVKLKSSGVDWIGDIPEHWEVSNLRRFLNILTDFSANGSFADLRNNVEYLDYDDYARLVRLTDLRENFNNSGVYVNKHAYNFLAKSSLHGNELLMANVGAYAGFVCLMPQVEFKATLGPNMFIIKLLKKKYSSEYAYYLLISDLYNSILSLRALSSAQPKLNKEDIKSLPLIRPSIEEQDEIVAYLKSEFLGIDELILKYQKQIDLIQEYRTSLISKVVTGKIDVRDWQRPMNSILTKAG